jgi:hypothetical protein
VVIPLQADAFRGHRFSLFGKNALRGHSVDASSSASNALKLAVSKQIAAYSRSKRYLLFPQESPPFASYYSLEKQQPFRKQFFQA